ncbi:MAG: IS200/IS605 family transposase [Actinomycetia bacterium]|nr:IS200/IS605 family transposase [Actinomycetes bacterium]
MASKQDDYRTGRHVVYRLTVHLVLVTKYRRGVITDRVRELLVDTAREVCERHGAALLEADGEDDHLHLLVDYPPRLSVSTLVGAVKTNTSKRVREQQWPEVTAALWGEHFWSPSYFACSTGGAPLERVAAYIRTQREPNKPPGRPKVKQ